MWGLLTACSSIPAAMLSFSSICSLWLFFSGSSNTYTSAQRILCGSFHRFRSLYINHFWCTNRCSLKWNKHCNYYFTSKSLFYIIHIGFDDIFNNVFILNLFKSCTETLALTYTLYKTPQLPVTLLHTIHTWNPEGEFGVQNIYMWISTTPNGRW